MNLGTVGIASVILLITLFLKMPVFISILGAAMSYFLIEHNIPSMIFAQQMTSGISNVTLLAIPFFVAMGVFMNYAGISDRIYDFAAVLTGRMTGGLAQVNIIVSAIMGGMSGSALADAAMDAKMLIPQMEKRGFSRSFSCAVTAFSATVTPIIPPGIGMILYGSLANVSIGKLFVSGLGLGIIITLILILLTAWICKRRGYVPLRDTKVTFDEFWAAFKRAFLPMMLPLVIIGGIRLGIFTATEAGAVGVLYAIVLGIIYKELDLKKFLQGLRETAESTASIMLIVGAATVFAWILTREKVPQSLMAFVVEYIDSKALFLLIVNIFLLIIGMFIEGNAAMVILVPLLAPIAAHYGINEIQFGMMFIINMAIGSISPPVGTLMFVTCGIAKCKIKDFLVDSIPYFILFLIILLLVTYVPFVTTFFVDLIY